MRHDMRCAFIFLASAAVLGIALAFCGLLENARDASQQDAAPCVCECPR